MAHGPRHGPPRSAAHTVSRGRPRTPAATQANETRDVASETLMLTAAPTLVFSLFVIGGKEITSPSASTRQG